MPLRVCALLRPPKRVIQWFSLRVAEGSEVSNEPPPTHPPTHPSQPTPCLALQKMRRLHSVAQANGQRTISIDDMLAQV